MRIFVYLNKQGCEIVDLWTERQIDIPLITIDFTITSDSSVTSDGYSNFKSEVYEVYEVIWDIELVHLT